MDRPVDLAMAQDRPPKNTLRRFWLEEVRALDKGTLINKTPWYLTLAGAEGKDIKMLIDEGLVEVTETASISEGDSYKIVAVEANTRAVASLQKKFVGLRIKEVNFRNLIRAEGPFSWPDGDDEQLCRAYIINLDLDEALRATLIDRKILFPVLKWVEKLCEIHSKPPALDWTLLLTLHAAFPWSHDVCKYMNNFFRDNANRDGTFRDQCFNFLGKELFDRITAEEAPDYGSMESSNQQRVLMIVVPKLLSSFVHSKGWRVSTIHNISYGGGAHAPMASWVIRFSLDPSNAAQPDLTYRDALRGILTGVKVIKEDGSIG